MANQREITCYEFDATPANIILRSLPIADVSSPSICLYTLSAPASPGGSPSNVVAYEFDGVPANVILRSLNEATYTVYKVEIVLRQLLAPEEEEEAPPSTYYGVLKRWTGAVWVKEPLKTYLGGSWLSKELNRWIGSTWLTIDTTGV